MFIAKSQLLYIGCPLTRERKRKKNSNFHFQKCPRPLTRECPLTECLNTEFDWEVKWGFEKASISRAVRLRECPLAES